MATERQIAANTANAKLSTGPRTAAGRSRSSRNSLKHGIRAQKIFLLSGEEAWIDVAEEYLAHFRPVGAYQDGLVMEMLQSRLAIDRSHRAEAGLFTSGWLGHNLVALQLAPPTHVDDDAANERPATSGLTDETLSAVERTATNAKTVANGDPGRAATAAVLFEVMNVKDTERAGLKILSDNFAQNSQMLDVLRRYRTSAENSFYRALRELQRDQGLEPEGRTATSPAVSVNGN